MVSCNHDTVEQTRGEMGFGDYFDVFRNAMNDTLLARPPEDYHLYLPIDKRNKTDRRIICKSCHLTTGWMKVDAPGMPAGVGVPVLRARWEEIKDKTEEQLNAEHRASAKRTMMWTPPADEEE